VSWNPRLHFQNCDNEFDGRTAIDSESHSESDKELGSSCWLKAVANDKERGLVEAKVRNSSELDGTWLQQQ